MPRAITKKFAKVKGNFDQMNVVCVTYTFQIDFY